MEKAISIKKVKTGAGHFKIDLETEKGTYTETTIDTMAIDDWNKKTENYEETGAVHLAEMIAFNHGFEVDTSEMRVL